MATLRNRRIMALLLQQAAEQLYTEIGTVYGATSLWNLTGTDGELPAEGDVKGMVQQYSQISPGRLNVHTALADVLASTEEATPGMFTLPSTASTITFTASGPVPLSILGKQGVTASLSIFRVSLFVAEVEAGDDFEFDILLNDVSLLPASISVSPGSNQITLVNAVDLTTTTLILNDILSYQATAGSARDVSCTLWVTSNE